MALLASPTGTNATTGAATITSSRIANSSSTASSNNASSGNTSSSSNRGLKALSPAVLSSLREVRIYMNYISCDCIYNK